MGSNPYSIYEVDLSCPVCKKPLSSPGAPPKLKVNKSGKREKGPPPHRLSSYQSSKDAKFALGKFKDNEEIVVAQCGHLFHKFCLRHYCYLFREGQTNHMCRVTCPICQRFISMMSSQSIDYRAHQDKSCDRDREFTKTSVMHTELSGQVDGASRKLERMCEQTDDGEHNLHVFRTHLNKLNDNVKESTLEKEKLESLKNELEHTDRMLTFMQTQHLKIVKKFIKKVREKSPKDFLHFPRRLAPYLNFIEDDDKLVRDLGEVIVPIHLNNLKSDRHSLLKGILMTVNERLNTKANLPEEIEQNKAKAVRINDKPVFVVAPKKESIKRSVQRQQPPIIVKVRRSSVSIMSSTVLTRESIQNIVDNVKDIPMKSKIDDRKDKKKKAVVMRKPALQQKADERKLDLNPQSSSSDIKIIFMPQRKALPQYSEPCRVNGNSDTFVAKVPKRRCRSTDAVIMRSNKKTSQQSDKDQLERPLPFENNLRLLERKKSQSIADISTDKEIVEKTEVLLLTPKPKPRKGSSIEPRNSSKPFTAIKSHKQAKSSEQGYQSQSESKTIPYILLDTNNNVLPELEKFSEVFDPRSEQNAGEITAGLVPRRSSLLEIIYDDLEEEKNFHSSSHQSQQHQPLQNEWCRNYSPQFFRVDKKGIVHPESLYHLNFRQPTFLSSLSHIKRASSDFSGSYEEADEENQLNSLSHEERLLIAAEKETSQPIKNNYGCIGKRVQFHGIPACLGMPNRLHRYDPSKDPRYTPHYLRKWQQQLASGREGKKIPNYCISSSKLVRSGSSLTRRKHTPSLLPNPEEPQSIYEQRESPALVSADCNQFSSSDHGFLPPLSMYPVKRPSTADCSRMAECGDGNCSPLELGEELILARTCTASLVQKSLNPIIDFINL